MLNYTYDRPIIILSAPRAGSTLLFETLANSSELITIGDESHGIFEANPRFNPLTGQCDSNVLLAEDASPEIVDEIRRRFFTKLCQQYPGFPKAQETKRLLEKTPKNALRVDFLNKVFPDARYIYLYRDPQENISSIMDGWESGRFVTYGRLPGREGKPRWSYLLPKGWQQLNQASIAELATFQWQSANEAIVDSLSMIDKSRWLGISYKQLIDDTQGTISCLSEFCQLSKPKEVAEKIGGQLKISRYTLTRPEKNKWLKNADKIRPLLFSLNPTVTKIKKILPSIAQEELAARLN